LSAFDIFLALPLAYGAFQGFRKGLLQELVGLIALVLGFILGLKLLTTIIPVVQKYIGNAYGLLPFISFLLIFFGVILGARFLGIVCKKMIDFTPLGMFDNLLGGVLGSLKICLALSLLLYVSGLAGVAVSQHTLNESVVYPVVIKVTPLAIEIMGWMLPFVKGVLSTLKDLF
jgi:membrane protein required for colicin V production